VTPGAARATQGGNPPPPRTCAAGTRRGGGVDAAAGPSLLPSPQTERDSVGTLLPNKRPTQAILL